MTRRTQERPPETGGGFLPRSGLVQEPFRVAFCAILAPNTREKGASRDPKHYTK